MLLPFFVVIPLVGLLLSVSIPGSKETGIAWAAIATIGAHLLFLMTFLAYWVYQHQPALDLKSVELVNTPEYRFFLDFYFDQIAAVYLVVGSFLTGLVVMYSRYYLHRERGFKRFFQRRFSSIWATR